MLPEVFCKRMRLQLGTEYEAFAESLEGERYRALRVNPLKGGAGPSKAREQFLASSPWRLEPVPWEADGFYYTLSVPGGQSVRETEDAGKAGGFDRQSGQRAEEERPLAGPGRHPYHDAGVYYIQEPSAMAPVVFLGAEPGEKVLDLCAAPGGKTTQIAGRMRGKGVLVSNEIHPQRARILSENVERLGIRNCLVLNETPQRLAEIFPGYFDRVLVDAPCSGEGMFRKNENAGEEWSMENVELCAARQDEILDCAVAMLRPGGRLVYSTCTFAPQEDEGSVSRLLRRHPEMEILNPEQCLNESGTEEMKISKVRESPAGAETEERERYAGAGAEVRENFAGAGMEERERYAGVGVEGQKSFDGGKSEDQRKRGNYIGAEAEERGSVVAEGACSPAAKHLTAWGFAPGRPDWIEKESEHGIEPGTASEVSNEEKSGDASAVSNGKEPGAKLEALSETWVDSGTGQQAKSGAASEIKPQACLPAMGIEKTLRLWPHRLRGEGHYLAVLQKGGVHTKGEVRSLYGMERGIPEKDCREYLDFAADTLTDRPQGIYLRFGEQLYLAPGGIPALKGLHVLRPGLHLGTLKKNRFEPSHALALALSPGEARRCCPVDSPGAQRGGAAAAEAYLKGQTFPFAGEKGWYLITVDGYSLGWGKLAGGIMKNHYPKGLRRT